ncbi:hypothetical protein CBR_g31973 [Chara braunii]|uniref:Uncharacterized protein n=1 Tax=Chara braunii TaxID=69332 RepID=A0A388LG75_CHABU|nr:hypothetical protein CBR_g31973 [Chara braunii]|eukprot:GBG81298.1 hypothetical protein CBR_g31973 [Chara braunii]
MFHKLGRKRLKVWEYLFDDAPQGRLDGNYIYRKAKVTETLKHYHGALTGAFETFVARCEILKSDLHKDQLTSKDYADLAKSGDGFNPVDSEEDSSESDLELDENKGGEGPGGGMVRSHDEGTVRSHERPVLVAAHSVGSMVAPMEGTGLPNMGICGPNDEDDIDMSGEASKLAPGDPISLGYCADPTTIYFLGGKHARTGEDKWGHDIVWHEGIFEPCIQDGEWKMAVKYTRGWQTFRRMSKDTWLKTTKLVILYRVQKENPGQSEGTVKDKAKELFSVNQTIGTMEESSSQDVVPLSASPPVPTQAGQREDDGTTVVKTQEVHMTSMSQISVATTEPSKHMDVSNALSSDAGATYGSLLMASAALEGTSEMQLESGVGLSVPHSRLQPELCTGKGNAESLLTPQGEAAADGGKGGDVEGILNPRNLETLTDDFDYGAALSTDGAREAHAEWSWTHSHSAMPSTGEKSNGMDSRWAVYSQTASGHRPPSEGVSSVRPHDNDGGASVQDSGRRRSRNESPTHRDMRDIPVSPTVRSSNLSPRCVTDVDGGDDDMDGEGGSSGKGTPEGGETPEGGGTTQAGTTTADGASNARPTSAGGGTSDGQGTSQGAGTSRRGGTYESESARKTRRTGGGKGRVAGESGSAVSSIAEAMHVSTRTYCEGLDKALDRAAGVLTKASTEGANVVAGRIGDMATQIGEVAAAMHKGNAVLQLVVGVMARRGSSDGGR